MFTQGMCKKQSAFFEFGYTEPEKYYLLIFPNACIGMGLGFGIYSGNFWLHYNLWGPLVPIEAAMDTQSGGIWVSIWRF